MSEYSEKTKRKKPAIPQGKGKEVLAQFTRLRDIKLPWLNLWGEVTKQVVTIRDDIYQNKQKGFALAKNIYDGTPQGALQLFASGLSGYMISQTMPWFQLRLPRFGLDDVPEVRQWLQESAEQLYYAFSDTNFYGRMWRYFEDGGSIGTAVTYLEEDLDEGHGVFHDVHPAQIYIAENQYERVDTLFRLFKQTLKQVADRFGMESMPSTYHERVKSNPYEEIEIIHCVYPRENREYGKSDKQNKAFESVWMIYGGSSQHPDDNVLSIGGYDRFPYLVWRYKKNSGEVYGRSPCMEILPEIGSLHEIGKTLLGAAHMASDPPLNVPAELRGLVQYKPRGLNYFEDPKKIVSPVDIGANYPVGIDRELKKQEVIRQALMVDFFLLMSRAEGQMTATEIIEKQGEKATIMGAAIGRLNSETLDPAIDRLYEMEAQAGRMPEPPAILDEFMGETIRVEYIGPLAQAQKRMFQSSGIIRGMESAAGLFELWPESRDVVDPDETTSTLLRAMGWPEKGLRSPKQIKEVREQRLEMQRQQAQMEEAMTATEGLKNVASADQATGGALSKNLGELVGAS